MTLRLELDGMLGRLLIDRPAKRNAFDLAMWESLPHLLDQAAAAPDLRVLLIKSANGGSFSAGADIAELLANKDNSVWRVTNQRAISEAQHRLARFPRPTVAMVEGDCIGGGCGVALACDIRIATPTARFGITPAKLGLVYPLHDIKLLVDLVGPGQAKRLLLTGNLVDAEEARRINLVEMIAADEADIVQPLLSASPFSTREIKALIRQVTEGQCDDDDATRATFAAAFHGPDFQEGTTAFVEKRKPRFGSLA